MAIFTALTGALVAAGLSTVVATAVVNIGIGLALAGISALISGVFAAKPQTQTPQAQSTLNQAAGARIRGYGRAKLGGTRAFWDSKSGTLYQVIMAHHGQIDYFEQFYVGDIAVTLGAGGVVETSPVTSRVWIVPKDGSSAQTAHSVMTAEWPDVWTTDHRLSGIANWLVLFESPPAEDFQKVFPESYNTPVRCVCRLSRVYDPRNDNTAWSDNPALCILDYLTHTDGYRLSMDDVDLNSFALFANVCDQEIPLAAGGTEKRYRLWGIYSLTDDPADVLNKMRATCDGEFFETDEGKIGIRGGTWQAPTVTITEDDILGHSMEQGNNRFSAFNQLKILYTSPDHDYQTTEAEPWDDLADQADRGVLGSELNLDMVPSASQARRLAKIHIAKANPAWKGTIVTNLKGLDALGERTIRLILPELQIDDAFFVAGFQMRPDLTGCEISVMSISEASYTWTTAEEGTNPPPPQDTRPDLTFPIPDNLTLTQDGGVVTAEVDDPGRTDLALEAEIRAGAGSTWVAMATQEDNPLTAKSGVLTAGTYQVRARWTLGGTVGEWTSPLAEITIV